MTERRVLWASLLSIVCISLYSQALMRRAKPVGGMATQTALPQAPPIPIMKPTTLNAVLPVDDEPTVALESQELKVEIGTRTGLVRTITLKRFLNSDRSSALRFGGRVPLLSIQPSGGPGTIESVQAFGNSASVKAIGADRAPYEVAYELDAHLPIIRASLRHSGSMIANVTWLRGDQLSSQQNPLEAFAVEPRGEKLKHHHFGGPWKAEKNVPRGTFLMALAERHFCLVARPVAGSAEAKLIPSTDQTIAVSLHMAPAAGTGTNALEVYVGPRDYFQLKSAEFQQAFPIGMLGQIGLGLLWFLSLLAKTTHSYGLAIILFAVAVTAFMAPFSLLGFRSMKRMQELKPQVDRIMAQHKNDSQKANKEVFQLYKENRVSPLGGCLPLLLQMPIFIALFQAITHFVDLRGAMFIGIQDLSLPDQLLRLPLQLPLVGSAINILPIVMAGAMYLQTRASQTSMGSASDNPTAKMMSGPLMPILFLFMFYQFPAGLVLYWLTNSLTSMALYKLVK